MSFYPFTSLRCLSNISYKSRSLKLPLVPVYMQITVIVTAWTCEHNIVFFFTRSQWMNECIHKSVIERAGSGEHTKDRIWRPCWEAQGRDNGCCLRSQHMPERQVFLSLPHMAFVCAEGHRCRCNICQICYGRKELEVILIFSGRVENKIALWCH